MTRKKSLTDDQIRHARSLYCKGVVGYGMVAKAIGVPISTIRDAMCGYTAYSAVAEGCHIEVKEKEELPVRRPRRNAHNSDFSKVKQKSPFEWMVKNILEVA